jgi:glycosyltransferase involved in cell wall biosynthesis
LHYVDFGNPGETRNFGYEKCLGEWIFFSDSDDEPAILTILSSVENVHDESIKVIVGNYEAYRSEQNCIDKIESQNLSVLLDSLPSGLGLWRFIFRKHYLDGKKIKFPALSMAEDQVFFLSLKVEQSEIKFEDKIFYRYFISRPFQLTRNKLKIQELKKSIQMTVKILEKDSKTNRFDFLSAQYFSLVLNCSKKYLVGNLLFLLKTSRTIIKRLGYKKMLLLISYPVRRIL